MGQDDGVDLAGRNGAGVPVAQAQLFVALKQTAIDQQLVAIVFYAVFGAGHRVGAA